MRSVDLLVDALATYRLARLAAADTLTESPRRAVVQWAFKRAGWRFEVEAGQTVVEALEEVDAKGHDIPKLATLVTCRWCVSVYLAAGVVTARRFAPRLWEPVAQMLSFSAVAALLAGLEEG